VLGCAEAWWCLDTEPHDAAQIRESDLVRCCVVLATPFQAGRSISSSTPPLQGPTIDGRGVSHLLLQLCARCLVVTIRVDG
jgi:hypothetical protein